MSLHTGSSALAHNLDRFDLHADFELVAAEAARLKVEPEAVRFYRDLYGDKLVSVRLNGRPSSLPAYEAEIRFQLLGERVTWVRQAARAAA